MAALTWPRLRGRPVLATGGFGLVVLLALGTRFGHAPEAGGVSTAVVARGPFVREVAAAGTLRAIKATPIIVPMESGRQQKLAFIAPNGSSLKAGDLVAEFDPWEAQKEAADGKADLAAARAKIEKNEAEGGKTARALALDRDVAQEALDRAETYQLSDERLFSRNDIIESRIDRTLSAKRADVAGRKLTTSGSLSATERALSVIAAGKAQLKINNAEKSLRALRIMAPHDGLLVLERNWRGETAFVGDSVWPGQKLAEIPELAVLEAKVFVLEADAGGLKNGLGAVLSIEGQPGSEYAASVSRVDALAKPRELQSPVRYFETTLKLDKADPGLMKPGQRVRATIRLEQVENVISIPRGALFEKDGKRIVYRLDGAGFVPIEVSVGRSSLSRVIVETALREGDRIALRDPTQKPASGGTAAAPARERP
jgi:multidrug efflux pump subunit AcrA (membrane-fusion protein)